MSYCVYIHKTADKNIPFYVGIGSHMRANSGGTRRTKWWHNIVNKHGRKVDITADGLSWERASLLEKFLIQEMGRKDIGTGGLVNMTNGGDGRCNSPQSQATKEKLAILKKVELDTRVCTYCKKEFKCKRWLKTSRCSRSCANYDNPRKGRPIGFKMTAEQKAKLSKAKTGLKVSDEAKKKMSLAHKKIVVHKKRNANGMFI